MSTLVLSERLWLSPSPWDLPAPARASFRILAMAEDFWPRQSTFPTERRLALRLMIEPVVPKSELLVHWSRTLTSNSCTPR